MFAAGVPAPTNDSEGCPLPEVIRASPRSAKISQLGIQGR
jgi:hypothetical protein